MSGAQDDKLIHIEGEIARYTGRDVIVQKAIRTRNELELFTEIQDVYRKSRKCNEKDNEKQRFPFMKRSKRGHGRFSSRISRKANRIKRLVKSYLPGGSLAY